VISRHALKKTELTRDLCILPVNGTPIPSQWHLVYPKARQISPIAAVFRTHLMQEARRWAQD
jgi:DNA-binding transcriptional LysR family regulator